MQGIGNREWGVGKVPTPNSRLPTPTLKTSRPFLADRDRLLYLAEVAKRSQCRPSQLLELKGMPAYLLDCTAAEMVVARDRGEFETEGNVVEW